MLILFCNGKQQLGFFTEAVVQNALVTCCKALSHYNLICCHMLAQKGCNSIIHWCIGHAGSRNVGLVSSRAAQICVGLWFLHILDIQCNLSVGSFSEGGGREGSCYQDHFLDWVFTNNCISPPKKATEYRLGT